MSVKVASLSAIFNRPFMLISFKGHWFGHSFVLDGKLTSSLKILLAWTALNETSFLIFMFEWICSSVGLETEMELKKVCLKHRWYMFEEKGRKEILWTSTALLTTFINFSLFISFFSSSCICSKKSSPDNHFETCIFPCLPWCSIFVNFAVSCFWGGKKKFGRWNRPMENISYFDKMYEHLFARVDLVIQRL